MSKILSFEEFINEDLWSKTFIRHINKDTRKEDTNEFTSYLKNVNWVDMGDPNFLFAEFDFNIKELLGEDDDFPTMQHIFTCLDCLPNDVSIMSVDLIDKLLNSPNTQSLTKTIEIDNEPKTFVEIKNEFGSIYFNIHYLKNVDSSFYYISKIKNKIVDVFTSNNFIPLIDTKSIESLYVTSTTNILNVYFKLVKKK